MKNNLLQLVIALSLSGAACAVMDDVNCFDYYKFGKLKFTGFSADKYEYAQGENLTLSYSIENVYESPLVEGAMWIIVAYRGPENVDRPEDDDVVDEFFTDDDISIQAGSRHAGNFAWEIPKSAKPGYYAISVYYMAKRKLSISGIAVLQPATAASASFVVAGTASSRFMIDKNSTTLNGNPYGFRQPVPSLNGTNAQIRTRLENPGMETVSVKYELFKWDDTEEKLDAYDNQETLTGNGMLSYDLKDLEEGAYVARITASSGDSKNILKVRFGIPGFIGRFTWLGLSSFPLAKDVPVNISFCMTNSAIDAGSYLKSGPAKGTVRIFSNGEKLFEDSYELTALSGSVAGMVSKYVPDRGEDNITLEADMYDTNGRLMDRISLVYDYSKFVKNSLRLEVVPEPSGDMAYSVIYSSESGRPLDGRVRLELKTDQDAVVSTMDRDVKGYLRETFSHPAPGTYTLEATELSEGLTDSKTFDISESPPPKRDETGDEQLFSAMVIAALAVIFVAMIVRHKRRKPVEGVKR